MQAKYLIKNLVLVVKKLLRNKFKPCKFLHLKMTEENEVIRGRKSYYICKNCDNKFTTRKQLERHLQMILGCAYLRNTDETLKKLMNKKFSALENNIESLKLDMVSIDSKNRSRRLKCIKDNFIAIERLYKNHGNLYTKEDSELLLEFIEDYRKEILQLVKTHYELISRVTLDDI